MERQALQYSKKLCPQEQLQNSRTTVQNANNVLVLVKTLWRISTLPEQNIKSSVGHSKGGLHTAAQVVYPQSWSCWSSGSCNLVGVHWYIQSGDKTDAANSHNNSSINYQPMTHLAITYILPLICKKMVPSLYRLRSAALLGPFHLVKCHQVSVCGRCHVKSTAHISLFNLTNSLEQWGL